MRWDGTTLAEVVKAELYSFFRNEISEASTMNNTEYTALLKKKHNHSGGTGYSDKYKTYINARNTEIEILFREPVPVEIYSENTITLTWSMAARQIRAWEYEKAHDENATQHTLTSVQEQWEKTHLCGGSVYVEGHCEYLIEPTEDTVINGKEVKKCNPYCTSENKVRKIGTGGLWTGLSPKFCPKRKALEQKNDEPTESDIALFEQYKEEFGRACRFEKVYGSEHKYAKQHWDRANEVYSKIVSKGLEQAYKKYRKDKRKPMEEEDNMARKFQLDAAITKDMKSAALDSFIDNIKMIDIKEIIPSEKNFYEMSDIELLADDIEREGLKHNLVVVKDPTTGLYEVKSGHRRLAAIERLIAEKRIKSTKIPCIVDGEKTEAENELDLIMLNATQRKYSDAELLSEYEHLSQILKKLKDEGKGISGHMRDNIAKILNVSNGQVGKLDNIKHNAVPEIQSAIKSGDMSISTANEIAKLAPEKQKEVVEKNPDISSAEVKKMQDKKPAAPPKPAETPINSFAQDESEEEVEITTEKKSTLTFSLILSENEAKTLLRFFYGFGDNYGSVSADDATDLREIKSKLKILCGKD